MNQKKHMSTSGIESIALQWFKAFNTHDLEKLLSLYDNEAKHYSPKLKIRMPETNGLITGKEELRGWWKDAFDRLPSLNYVITSLTANESRIFMEYIRKVDGEEDMLIAEILEIRNGLIFASRVYHG